MKKRKYIILGIGILFLSSCLLPGCSNNPSSGKTVKEQTSFAKASEYGEASTLSPELSEEASRQENAGSDALDMVDLTKLSSTMVYSEVYNMMYEPENYIGKTIKMTGTFAVYDEAKQNYYACVIADATACCSQGIEFEWRGEHSYPEDYPEIGSDITVQGTFETYKEDGYTYCHLADAVMLE